MQLLRPLRQHPGNLQYDGHARGVVVGAVVDGAAFGRQCALRAIAQVIVMGADHDDLVRQRPGAGQNGRDVLHFAMHVPNFRLALDSPAGQIAAGRLERAVDFIFDLAQFLLIEIMENAVDGRPAERDDRQIRMGKRSARDMEGE